MQHYYSTNEMENKLAGEGYSTANGTWVTGEKIIFGLITIPAGTRAKPHSHPNEQFSIVLSGTIRVDVEGDVQTLTKGNINYRPANAIHASEVIGDEDYVFVTAKDTSWGIQGKPEKATTCKGQTGDGNIQHFYNLKEMEKKLAGEGYSSAKGSWITGERLIFGEFTMAAGTKADPHAHPNEQMIIILNGTVALDIDGDKKTVKKGDIIHIPSNAIHSSTVTGNEDCLFITAKDTSWGIQGNPA